MKINQILAAKLGGRTMKKARPNQVWIRRILCKIQYKTHISQKTQKTQNQQKQQKNSQNR